MNVLVAMAPPMAVGDRLGVAFVSFGLVLALSSRLRGYPSQARCGLMVAGIFLLVFGLDSLGIADPRGILAVFIGMAAAAFVGSQTSGSFTSPERRRSSKWLAVAAVLFSLCLGIVGVGFHYWMASQEGYADPGEFVFVFALVLFAGLATAALVLILGLPVRPGGKKPETS